MSFSKNINIAITEFLKGLIDSNEQSPAVNTEIIINKSAPNQLIGADMITYKKITIRKRNDNRWYARVKIIDKKYKYIYGNTQQECLKNLKHYLKNKPAEKEVLNKTTLTQWLNKWYELYKKNKISAGTEKLYKHLRKKYIEPNLGDYEINSITSIQIMEFLNTITAERQKQKVYSLLHDSLNKAFLNKIITDNPMLIIEKPQHEKKHNRALTIKEQQSFIDACKNNVCGDYFLVTLYQGLRKSETFNIYISDINFEEELLTISQKDNKQFRLKTKGSARTIPLFKSTKEILKKHTNKPGAIFTHSQVKIYEEFKNVCKDAKIKNATIHTLRHTFITRCIENNIPLKIVQTWAGHTTSKMTNDVYTHINNEFQTKCKQELDTLFDTLFKK